MCTLDEYVFKSHLALSLNRTACRFQQTCGAPLFLRPQIVEKGRHALRRGGSLSSLQAHHKHPIVFTWYIILAKARLVVLYNVVPCPEKKTRAFPMPDTPKASRVFGDATRVIVPTFPALLLFRGYQRVLFFAQAIVWTVFASSEETLTIYCEWKPILRMAFGLGYIQE